MQVSATIRVSNFFFLAIAFSSGHNLKMPQYFTEILDSLHQNFRLNNNYIVTVKNN